MVVPNVLKTYKTTSEFKNWELKEGLDTPVIALSACVLENEVNMALEAGCLMYLSKPLKKQSLIDCLISIFLNKS